MFAVCVTFVLKSGTRSLFLPMICANAVQSRQNETGCHQFDVATDPAREDEVFLYEIYQDSDAFAQHLKTAHYRAFDAASANLIAEKRVRTYSEVVQ